MRLNDFLDLIFFLKQTLFGARKFRSHGSYLPFEFLAFFFLSLSVTDCDLAHLFTRLRHLFCCLFFQTANDLITLLELLLQLTVRDGIRALSLRCPKIRLGRKLPLRISKFFSQ